MIKLENTEVIGWEAAIRGMRNPMNSWAKSDSIFIQDGEYHDICGNKYPTRPKGKSEIRYLCEGTNLEMGQNDIDLMMRLSKAGSVDGKFMRMIVVYVDITAPLYWWKEFDTYKVGTVANSCSTMHKIQAKEFVLDDFSHEHLVVDEPVPCTALSPRQFMEGTINALNGCRDMFLRTKDKKWWWQMIQLLPSSYNQRRTIMLNYEVLAGIYPKRKNHKLDEWHEFCDWIRALPYSELITCRDKDVYHPEGVQPQPKPTYISQHDRLVISAYTGYMMADFDDIHKFVENILGRPVLTHELKAGSETNKELQEKLHDEFVDICKAAVWSQEG